MALGSVKERWRFTVVDDEGDSTDGPPLAAAPGPAAALAATAECSADGAP